MDAGKVCEGNDVYTNNDFTTSFLGTAPYKQKTRGCQNRSSEGAPVQQFYNNDTF